MSGDYTDPEQMKRELQEAGWKKINRHTWQAPNGELFRGPCEAWDAMRRLKDSWR